jgi:hypothetical protein
MYPVRTLRFDGNDLLAKVGEISRENRWCDFDIAIK